MKIRRLNEDAKRFYIDEIVSGPSGKTETERHSFSTIEELKQYCKDAGLTKEDIAACGGCDVKDLCEDVEKLHTKPNGEYLVKADSGKGYTAFSRDNVAIGGIDNEDADSDDKAIDKFKRNEYSECLNEAYFDTAECRIQRYEEDIPELVAGMHDDYMEGKLAAEFYAKALEKVYNALADCDYKHTMSQAVKTETNSQKILNALDNAEPKTIDDAARVVEENLTERAEKCYAAKYIAVDSEGNKTQKKICFMCDGTIEDAEKLADELIKEPYSELNVIGSVLKDAARKDGFVFVESCNGPVRNKSTCGKRSLKESFDEVGTFTYRYVPDDIDDLPEDVLEKYTEEQIEEFIESKNIPDDLWLTSEAFITYEEGSYQVSHGGWDDYRFYSTIEDCIHDVEGWYDIFEWVDDVSNIEYSAPDEEDYDEYDDEYSDEYDESLEECSGIKAHKVIMGEDIDDSIEFDDVDGVEGPEGDKTEDIEFVMDEYVSESLLIDFIEKVDPITYKVGANDQVVTVVFDPKWSEYVYTIDGKGPYSHSSYEFISRDIYDFVMSQIDASELDDLDD